MSEKKSKAFTIGLVLIILGALFLPLLFQIVAFTGTVVLTPQKFSDELEDKFEKGEDIEGDSWLVYGWIQNKTEFSKEEQDVIGYKFLYIFKKNIVNKVSDEDATGFFSNNSYIAGTDILVEIEIKDGMPVESNRFAFPIPEIPGIIILIIGVILFMKGKKGKKEKPEKDQGSTFSQGDMAGFTQSPNQYPQPPGQLTQPYSGGAYTQPPGQTPQQPFSQAPQGGYGGGQPPQQQQSYGQPSGFTSPTYPSGPTSQPSQTPPPQMPFPQLDQSSSQNFGAPQSPEIHQGNVGVPMYVKCPACGEKMPAPPIRPARVQCQKCGTKGTIN